VAQNKEAIKRMKKAAKKEYWKQHTELGIFSG
jgi:hypothetical protein